jgi:hypothetical protein
MYLDPRNTYYRTPGLNGARPWYYESPEPRLLNEWSVVHLGTGLLFGTMFPGAYKRGFLTHTAYEAVEGKLFPAQTRDVSMKNHVGDTLAFMLGIWAATKFGRK